MGATERVALQERPALRIERRDLVDTDERVATVEGWRCDRPRPHGDPTAGRVLASPRPSFGRAYATNLALNTAWTPVFFRAHRPWLAAADSAALTVSTVDLARRAARVSRPAAAVLAPYAAWTAFATALTVAIARRN